MKLFAGLVLTLLAAAAFAGVSVWDEYGKVHTSYAANPMIVQSATPTSVEQGLSAVAIENYWSVPGINLVVSREGYVSQSWHEPTYGRERPFGVKFNGGLQVEAAYADFGAFSGSSGGHGTNLLGIEYFKREWQLPPGGSFMVSQYKLDPATGAIDWDTPPVQHVVSTTTDTVLVIQPIRNGFEPLLIDDTFTTNPPIYDGLTTTISGM